MEWGVDAATATEELFAMYHNELYRYVRFSLRNQTAAEDLVQDIFLQVLKSWGQYRGDASPKTWLWTIARNCVVDYTRKHKRDRLRDLFIDEVGGVAQAPGTAAIEAEELMRCVTGDQRQVVVLRVLQDWSISDTAKILGWSESKVKTTLHRAIEKMRREGGGDDGRL